MYESEDTGEVEDADEAEVAGESEDTGEAQVAAGSKVGAEFPYSILFLGALLRALNSQKRMSNIHGFLSSEAIFG